MINKSQIKRCAEDTDYFVALYFGTKDHRIKPEEKKSIEKLISQYGQESK